jgi:hypothetical protein
MLALLRAAAFRGAPERKYGRRARTSSGSGCLLVARGFVSSFVARVKIVRVASDRPPDGTRSDFSVVSGGARTSLCVVATLATLAVALASGLKDLPGTWRWLSDQHAQFEGLSPKERAQEPGTAQLLPVEAFDFFRSKLQDGDRYYLAVRHGKFTAGVDRATAGRIFGRFYLLPAIQVDEPAKADAVLTIGIDPHTLGVPLGPIAKFGGGDYFEARVRR